MTSSSSLNAVFSRYAVLVIVVVVVAAATGFLTDSHRTVQSYTGSVGITVQAHQEIPSNSTFVGGQADVVAQGVATVESWISDPSVVSNVLTQAGQTDSSTSVMALSQKFGLVPGIGNSASFQVQVTDTQSDNVTELLNSLVSVLTKQVTTYNASAASSPTLYLSSTSPVVTASEHSSYLPTVAAFLAGCLIAIVLVIILERKRKTS